MQDLIKKDIAKQVANAQLEGLKKVFPVGSRYVTQDADTNPSTILGFGTWTRFNGLVAVGVDEDIEEFNEIGKTVGEVKHTLTQAELASHQHIDYTQAVPTTAQQGTFTAFGMGTPSTPMTHHTEKAGGDQPHNNVQPTKVVGYMWIREE